MPVAAPPRIVEIEETDVILLWGSNAREAHPIFFHHLLKGIDNGARMYAVDPRRTSSSKFADAWLGLSVGTDIALANAVAREIIHNGWVNHAFIDHSTTGYEAFAASVEPYTLEVASEHHRSAGCCHRRDGGGLRHG